MKMLMLTVLAIMSVILYGESVIIPADSLHDLNIILPSDHEAMSLFPDYKGFLQARLYQTDSTSFYFEIIYKPDDIILIDKYYISSLQLEELRLRIRDNRSISQKDLTNTSTLLEEKTSHKRNEGRLRFIWAYSALTVTYYAWAIPSNFGLKGPQTAGTYMLLSGSTITYLIIGTKDKNISYADADFSINYALRGLLDGYLLMELFGKSDSPATAQITSLVSIAEGVTAYQFSKKMNITEGQANAIPLYHDFLMAECLGLFIIADIDRFSEDIICGTELLAGFAGTGLGYFRSQKINYSAGDAIASRTLWYLYGSSALTLAVVIDANKEIGGFLYTTGGLAGILMGEKYAQSHQLSNAEGYYLALSTYAGFLVGFGVSLLGQSEDKNYKKSNLLLCSLGSVAGFYLYSSSLKNIKHASSYRSKKTISIEPSLNLWAYHTNESIINLKVRF